MQQENLQEGMLFDSVLFKSNKDVESLINNLSYEQAYYMITLALQQSQKLGVFSLLESEILSKSLRILNSNITEN